MKITIEDIAKKANVSTMTVSRVLNNNKYVSEKTFKKVRKIIDELGYQPNLIARSLSSKRSMNIGVIIPKKEHLLWDNYIAQVLSGISDVAMQNNYRIMLCPLDSDSDDINAYVNIARTKLVDGLLLLKTKINDKKLKPLAESNIPFVLINHKKRSKDYNFVDTKNIEGAKLAVRHLWQKGHKNIAFITGSLDETNAKDRLKGFKDEMKKLKLKDDLIINGEFDKEIASREVEKLMKGRRKPTAIFASDDYMALGAMEKLTELGFKIPEDVAVVGFDNIELSSYMKPSLTTIGQSLDTLGKTSATVLLNLINGDVTRPVHKLLDVKLIERDSS